MKFIDFLRESEEVKDDKSVTVGSIRTSILKKLESESKDLDIFIVDEIYLIDYTKPDEAVKSDDVAGYFIYKEDSAEQDDFYYSKFIYRVAGDNVDIEYDEDNENSFTTLADLTLSLKKLKANKMEH